MIKEISKKEIQKILKDDNKIIVYKALNYYSYNVKYENNIYYKCTNRITGYKKISLENIHYYLNHENIEWYKIIDK